MTHGTEQEPNPGHIGGRRALSPLRHPHLLLFLINVDSFLFWVLVVRRFRSDIDWRKVVDDVKFSLGVEDHACSFSWPSFQSVILFHLLFKVK